MKHSECQIHFLCFSLLFVFQNLSARLMAKANGNILVDRPTYDASRGSIRFNILPPIMVCDQSVVSEKARLKMKCFWRKVIDNISSDSILISDKQFQTNDFDFGLYYNRSKAKQHLLRSFLLSKKPLASHQRDTTV
jgi:hypothetical protein